MTYRYLKKLEDYRKEIDGRLFNFFLLTIVIAVIIFSLLNFKFLGGETLVSALISCTISFGIYEWYKDKVTADFNMEFKNNVMHRIVSKINPNLEYYPYDFINLAEFNYPQIYKYPDIYNGNDLILGNIDGVDIKFSDVHLQEKVERVDSRGNRRVNYYNIFQGILFIADFHKNFTSKTYVISSFGVKTWGELAYMDNSEFENEFEVYTDDQINARYILTPKLMEQILKIKKLFNCSINIAFLDNKIYIYIEFNRDSFEPDISRTLLGRDSIILQYQNEVEILISLVKELSLNTRIWR
ncbi:MAG: DUF3137 domain-containing protein [Campylobacteraceae bacterium]|nr:DUF3137 domain-containing protein [Campylobacteraceae bacterium]